MAMTLPKICVVICSYNRANYITLALNSLTKQTVSPDQFEVIVVDNNSTDNTKEVCMDFIRNHPAYQFRYITEEQQGSSFARNKGASLSLAPLLCFMDDDAIAKNDYIEKIITFFDTHPYANALGGRIIPRYIPGKPKWISYHVSSLVGNFDYSKHTIEFAPDRYPLESNMIVLKKNFDEINGFSTSIPGVKGTLRIGGEGKDFFLRLKAKGKKVFYSPDIIVEHIVEVSKLTPAYMYRVASGIGRGERVRTLQISKWAFIKKFIEYIYKLCGSIVLGVVYFLSGKPSQFWPVIKFRIDALKGLLNR